MYDNPTVIGEFIEAESRDVTEKHTSYAADWQTLRTKPGRYPLTATFDRLSKRPYWIVAAIDADRIAGRTYSGFAGNNFASREEKLEPQPLRVQSYAYNLYRMVEAGNAVVAPEFQHLVDESREFLAKCAADRERERIAADAHPSGEHEEGDCYICRLHLSYHNDGMHERSPQSDCGLCGEVAS